jgi:hypothetical protein
MEIDANGQTIGKLTYCHRCHGAGWFPERMLSKEYVSGAMVHSLKSSYRNQINKFRLKDETRQNTKAIQNHQTNQGSKVHGW